MLYQILEWYSVVAETTVEQRRGLAGRVQELVVEGSASDLSGAARRRGLGTGRLIMGRPEARAGLGCGVGV